MKYLKKFNENINDLKSILMKGFETLIDNTHLVDEQVEDNYSSFLEELDEQKFKNLFGNITKFLGAGVFGAVFQLDNGKILKITFDFHEAPFLYKYCRMGITPGLVKVDSVYKIKFGKTNAYIIVRDPVNTNFDRYKYKEDIKKAEDAMYEISPNWRGTHKENFGIQNGKVVLYDGFCKKADVDETILPSADITKNFNLKTFNIIDKIKEHLIIENVDDEFDIRYDDLEKNWKKFVDKQENGDCQSIVSSIIHEFPEVTKVFGEIEVDEPYYDEDGDEQILMTHHWVEIDGEIYDFSKGTLKNYIDFYDIYDPEVDENWRYNGISN